MVDYSKWKDFGAELSDSEDEDEGPRVTQLSAGDRVSVGPTGLSLVSPAAGVGAPSSRQSAEGPELNRQTGASGVFRWSQDATHVCVEVPASSACRAKSVSVDLSAQNVLSVREGDALLAGGALRYAVQAEEGGVDWELLSGDEGRFVRVTLTKKSPIAGAVLWWSCVFVGDDEIDVGAIRGRKSAGTGAGSLSDSWKEAHRMFRERVGKEERVLVDADEDGG